MKTRPPATDRDGQTRRRLMDAGTRLFAERGFKHVPVRLLCDEAKANVAAVNYHFGDKLGLYRAVLEEAVAVILHVTEEVVKAGQGLEPTDRLREYIRIHCAHMRKASGPNTFQQLLHRELQEPTKLLGALVDRVWKPRFAYLGEVVSALVGLPADDDRVVRSVVSIHAQIVMFKPSPAHARMGKAVTRAFDLNEAAEHIIAFSLAGLNAYRQPQA